METPTEPTIHEAEAKAAMDRDLLKTLPRVQIVTVPIQKLLKHPKRYVRRLPETVLLVGENAVGGRILVLRREGTQLRMQGHVWAMDRLRAALPEAPTPTDPPEATATLDA